MQAGRIAIISGTLALLTLAACSPSARRAAGGAGGARAALGQPGQRPGQLHAQGEQLLVEAELSGLTPGEHGFHVHGAATARRPTRAAPGAFHPAGKPHGHHHGERHAGDLPNLVAGQDGRASYRGRGRGLTADSGALGIIGRSVVVHADADDYRS